MTCLSADFLWGGVELLKSMYSDATNPSETLHLTLTPRPNAALTVLQLCVCLPKRFLKNSYLILTWKTMMIQKMARVALLLTPTLGLQLVTQATRRLALQHGLLSGLGVTAPARASLLPQLGKPKIPTVPRQELNRDLAVLLMRSSYNATDDLDFVAMDQFQREFFLRRQNAWEPYVKEANEKGTSVSQGELTDAFYFDFISFAQYETINACLGDPRTVFEELRTAEGETDVIYRSNGLEDKQLATAHGQRVGDAILDFIIQRFNDVDPSSRDIQANLRQLFQWFVVLGFAADIHLQLLNGRIQSSALAPANLWSLQALKQQQLSNDFIAKTLSAYLRRNPFVLSFEPPVSVIKDGVSSVLNCRVYLVG